MRLPHNLGMILLAIWLICTGLASFGLALPSVLLAILAIAAGVLILMGR